MYKPKWNMISPVNMNAELDSVNQVVWNLSFLLASKIVTLSSDNPGEYGFDDPLLQVSISYEKPGNGGTINEVVSGKSDLVKPTEIVTKTLLVGNKVEPDIDKTNYYAKLADDGIIFEIGWTDVRDYSIELVSRNLFTLSTESVKSINVKHPDKELSLQKNEENIWQMTLPENKLLSGNFVEKIISFMKLLMAESIVEYSNNDLSKYGLDNSQFSVTIGTNEGDKSLLVGKEDGPDYFVTSTDTNFVYLINKNKIDDIIEASVYSIIK